MFGSGYENCPEFGVLGGVFLSSIFCKQEDKLLFFESVSGCTCLILDDIYSSWDRSCHIYNYITSVFHWNITMWLVMKWSHDYKRDVLHPNKTQTRTCTCLHDDVRCKQSMA